MELTYAQFTAEIKLNSTLRPRTTLIEKLKKLLKKTYKKDKFTRNNIKRVSQRSARFYKPFDPTQNYQVIYMC